MLWVGLGSWLQEIQKVFTHYRKHGINTSGSKPASNHLCQHHSFRQAWSQIPKYVGQHQHHNATIFQEVEDLLIQLRLELLKLSVDL